MKNYFIATYGCQMNKSDSERIAGMLEEQGWQAVSKEIDADLIVVNMCSVRQSAVDRVYGILPKLESLKNKNPKLKTILTGCILSSDKRKLKKHFDWVLDIKDLVSWPQIITPEPGILIGEEQDKKVNYLKVNPKYKTDFRAFIPVSNGCHNACTYCVVPSTRGPLVCRSHQDILREAKELVVKKYKEIWLLGQNVNDYQSPANPSINFAQLLKRVSNIPGNFWLRFTSPNPKDFTDEMIQTIAQCQKITEYINIPVQSGDNEILRKMNRPYTVEKYKDLIKKIRHRVPGISLSTDIIVGFPSETEKQFQNTVNLFKEIKFDLAYIAQYSKRPGTPAARLKDVVSAKEKMRRWKLLSQILRKTALEKNKQYIGKKIKVLVDKQKKGFFYGKTRTYKTVKFSAPDFEPNKLLGQFVTIKVSRALPWGLKATLSSYY